MSKKLWCKRALLCLMTLCLICSGAWLTASAADGDTVTVSGVSVEWDGNGGAQDLVMLELEGAAFTANTVSNSHWEYFAPYVLVNGTPVTGQVAWAQEGMYGALQRFCFFLAQNVLKQDGTDVIEVLDGCKIPLNNGADYYVVSGTASFIASVNATNTGHEAFMPGAQVSLSGVSVEWDGNGGAQDLVMLELEGAAFTANTVSNSHWEYFAPYVLVNGTPVTGQLAWAQEGMYGALSRFCFFLNQGVLKQDGTDVIEVLDGCRVPLNDGAGSYLIAEGGVFESTDATSGHFTQRFVWREKKYDADGSVLTGTEAQTGVLGGYDAQQVVISNIGGTFPDWGIAGFAANTANNLTEGQFAVFRLVTPLDAAAFGSLTIEYMYNSADLLYVYPLNAAALGYEQAVQSFRSSGAGINSVTLSTGALAENGMVGGFIVQLADGAGAQFFLDSLTPAASAVEPGPVEEIPGFTWTAGQKYDADGTALQSAGAGSLGEFSTAGLYFGSGYPEWGLTGDGFAHSANALAEGEYLVFGLAAPMAVSEIGSISIEVMYNAEALFYVYPLNAAALGYAQAVQSFRTPGSGRSTFALSSELLAENGVVNGFILQMAEGESAQFFLDSLTPAAEGVTVGPVEPTSFRWKIGNKVDADETVFVQTEAGAIGEFTSLRVVTQYLNVWGLTASATFCETAPAVGQFLKFEFTVPVTDTSVRSFTLEFMHNAEALFYVYPLNAEALGYGQAVQSFRTPGSGVHSVALSAEGLFADGAFGGFLIQLADGAGAQFFLDSVTLSTEAVAAEVEEVVSFAWEIGTVYDADGSLFVNTPAASIGEFTSLSVVTEYLNAWGITASAAFCTSALAEGQFLKFEFAVPVTDASVRSFTLEVMHLAEACFYVYPLNAAALGFEHAVQSFRVPAAHSSVQISAEGLFADGVCGGFVIQLMTETGAQFFLDSVTLSTEAVAAEVEDLNPPVYEISPVSVLEAAYTYRYEGGNVDLLMITFDRSIFNRGGETGLWNERMGVEDFAACLFINGVSLADSGVGQYALRDMWTRHDRLGVFLTSGVFGSANNDAFDIITFAAGFAVRGSSGDYTMYTTEAEAVFYTNRALDAGGQVVCSSVRDPQVDQSLTPLAVSWSLSGGSGSLAVVFDKTVRTEEEGFGEILGHLLVDGVRLSDWESAVAVAFDGMTIRLTFAGAAASPEITVEQGLTVQTNPDQPLTRKSVARTRTFVRLFEGEDRWFAREGELFVYWVGAPVYSSEGSTDYVTFDVRLSALNAAEPDFTSEALGFVMVDGTSLSDILAEDGWASVSLSAFAMTLRLPASCLGEGTELVFRRGFVTPAGGQLATDERFIFDGLFGQFNGEVRREEIEDRLTPTGVNNIIRATDGVAPGTNQLFIEFTTPCSVKYLPFAQADPLTLFNSYGAVGVSMTARYAWELNRYGIRESLWQDLLLDGRTLREWAEADGGAEASRCIDVYYQGTNFGVYYLQIVITERSSAVMDWSQRHTLTFKAGFVTPAFGVFTEDVQFAWDPETGVWAADTSGRETVDPGDQLKDPLPAEGCGAAAGGAGLTLPALLLTAAAAVVCRAGRRAAKKRS